jgi:hypothetical protein
MYGLATIRELKCYRFQNIDNLETAGWRKIIISRPYIHTKFQITALGLLSWTKVLAEIRIGGSKVEGLRVGYQVLRKSVKNARKN